MSEEIRNEELVSETYLESLAEQIDIVRRMSPATKASVPKCTEIYMAQELLMWRRKDTEEKEELNCLDGALIAMHIAMDKFTGCESRCDEFIEEILGAFGERALVARAKEMGQMELSGLEKYMKAKARGKVPDTPALKGEEKQMQQLVIETEKTLDMLKDLERHNLISAATVVRAIVQRRIEATQAALDTARQAMSSGDTE